jgi:DNA-binding NtrC family response regulator
MSLSSVNQAAGAILFETSTKLREIEKTVIIETLRVQKYNRTHAARVLGIGIRTLQRKLKRYGLSDIGLKVESLPEYGMASSH